MKMQSTDKPDVYAVSGRELRIHWDIQQITREGMEGPETYWEAYEALCGVADKRDILIEKIMASRYTTGAELAAINNQTSDPDEYAAYQAFRALAKQLADNWLAGPVNVNTATQAELEELSGVGATTAKAIIAGRPWAATADLSSISGVSNTMVSGWNVTV